MVICYWHDHHFIDCIIKNNGDSPNASSTIFYNRFVYRINGPRDFFKKRA